eukprot:TRINITY_DN43572_c0_g1_i1.p1 TRINITY_DN43572_c0_g1~~TRINITY_DN43572_c0_g1_i1.p1  ORF type:complete len:435 (+),score=111.48 TRINITY_DN43572_c0_g1_i1:69-1373(+)
MAGKPKTVIVGGGIGGCAAAIALHHAGADVTIYESAPQLLEIGAGINVQAVAIGALSDMGIPVEKFHDRAQGDGILTSKLEYYTTDGIFIADEAVGLAAGAEYPQMSVHRAKFHTTLVNECRRLLGEDRVIIDHTFVGMQKDDEKVTLQFQRSSTKEKVPDVVCDFLIGCDGLKSRVRAALLGEQEPRYTGRTIYRGLCELDGINGDGNTVSLCGDETGNFICYPISDGMRQDGKFHCNWGFNAQRPHPGGAESWTALAKLEDIREELAAMDQNKFGGWTPLQMAEKTEKIIGWALFDREPLDSFDFGIATLLGDSAHPLLPYGSQGATQAIMDAEALGVCYAEAMEDGKGVKGVIQAYSAARCEVSGKVVIANRNMGSTAVLREANQKCQGMSRDEKEAWVKENGPRLHQEIIMSYRASMPKSVRTVKRARKD